MGHYLYKLTPPRPTVGVDMTEAEASIMEEHAGYWQQLVDNGVAIAFGPVVDPSGLWGVAVVEAESEQDAAALSEGDPAIDSGLATYAVYAMPGAVVRR